MMSTRSIGACVALLLTMLAFQMAAASEQSTAQRTDRQLMQVLEEDDVEIEEVFDAVSAAKQSASSAEVAEILIGALQSGRATVRNKAALGLHEIPEAAEQAVPALIAALQDPDAAVRGGAASSLAGIASRTARGRDGLHDGRLFKNSIPDLVAALNDRDDVVRANIAATLGSLGSGASAAQSALRARLNDNAALVRVEAASALWQISKGVPQNLWVEAAIEGCVF